MPHAQGWSCAKSGSSSAHLSDAERLGCSGQVLGLLQQHQHLVLDENFDSGLVERTEEPSAEQGDVHVWGSLVAFVERLDDELFKSLQVRAWSREYLLYLDMHSASTLVEPSALMMLLGTMRSKLTDRHIHLVARPTLQG